MVRHYLSNLRILGTFCVILLHIVAKYVLLYNDLPSNLWNSANFIDAAVRFCVPVFLMISGAVLLGKDEPLSVFLGKRFKRILYPFIIWNLFYFFFFFDYSLFSPIGFARGFVKAMFVGAAYHFWYIYMILGVYLFIPIIRKWTIVCTQKECVYFLGIWAVTLAIPSFARQYFPAIELMYFSKYIGYLILGFYLDKFVVTQKSKIWIYILIFIAGFVSTFYPTYYFTNKTGELYELFYEILTPNVMLMAVGLFLFFKQIMKNTNEFLINLDKCSYGVYLIHVFVLHWFFQFFELSKAGNAYLFFLYAVLSALGVFLFSTAIIFLLSKIKPIKSFIT
jgi:surface polysaccharide O-acyltransferase-like enzyme